MSSVEMYDSWRYDEFVWRKERSPFEKKSHIDLWVDVATQKVEEKEQYLELSDIEEEDQYAYVEEQIAQFKEKVESMKRQFSITMEALENLNCNGFQWKPRTSMYEGYLITIEQQMEKNIKCQCSFHENQRNEKEQIWHLSTPDIQNKFFIEELKILISEGLNKNGMKIMIKNADIADRRCIRKLMREVLKDIIAGAKIYEITDAKEPEEFVNFEIIEFDQNNEVCINVEKGELGVDYLYRCQNTLHKIQDFKIQTSEIIKNIFLQTRKML